MGSIGEMGVFPRDAGCASYEGTDSLRFHTAGHGSLLVSRPEGSPLSCLERVVDVAAPSCSVHCMARYRLLDESGVLQRCRDQGVHEPLRSEPESARKTAANLVLFPSPAAQIRPVESARSRPADHLGKCSPQNQIRPWDSLACVLGGWGIALHDIRALQACGPNFPGNSPAMLAPGLDGIRPASAANVFAPGAVRPSSSPSWRFAVIFSR